MDREDGNSAGEWPHRVPDAEGVPDGTSDFVDIVSGQTDAEHELIDAVRAGDPAAMAILYERHRPSALKFARYLMAGTQDAEDVVHEGFAKAVSAIRNGFGPTDTFMPYLNTCIRSVATSFWKKQAREKPAPAEDLDPGPSHDPALENALNVFEHADVAAAMRSLPPRWRTVLWHAEVMGEPPRNIAPLLGLESNAVSALLIRARAGLRAAYELQALAAAERDRTRESN